jgi:hypothetical protein
MSEELILVGDREGPLGAVKECLREAGVGADLVDPSERSWSTLAGRKYREALIEAEYSIRVLKDAQAVSAIAVKREISTADWAEAVRLIRLLQEFLPGSPHPSFVYHRASLKLLNALKEISPTLIPASDSPQSIVAAWLHAVPTARSTVPMGLLHDAMTRAFPEIRHRLSRQPFRCDCLACGLGNESGEFKIWAGEIPAEIRAEAQIFKEAVGLGRAVSFELPAQAQGARLTVGLLPIDDSALILCKNDRPQPESQEYGLDTHFFHQARLAVEEVLRHQLAKQKSMESRNDPTDGNAQALLAAFEPEQAAFREMLPKLMQSCKGWFVAFRKGELIDKDEDEFALARRLDRQFKSEFVLVTRVSEEAEPVILDSPEGEIP